MSGGCALDPYSQTRRAVTFTSLSTHRMAPEAVDTHASLASEPIERPWTRGE